MKYLFWAIALFLVVNGCSGSDDTTGPDSGPLTLDGNWAVSQFQTEVNGYNAVLNAPNNIATQLRIDNNKFRETGTIYATAFTDSGSVTEDGDSLRFYSLVIRRFYMGILKTDHLVINKYMSHDYQGLAVYRKKSGTDY